MRRVLVRLIGSSLSERFEVSYWTREPGKSKRFWIRRSDGRIDEDYGMYDSPRPYNEWLAGRLSANLAARKDRKETGEK